MVINHSFNPSCALRYHALPRTAPVPAVPHYTGPLLTRDSADTLRRAHDKGAADWQGSLDLGRSQDTVALNTDGFHFRGQPYPWPGKLKDRTLYYWDGEDFAPISRYSGSLIKLVPTEWGAPTFEIDGIKMLPTSKLSPFEDARRKVELVAPAGKVILDTCGGLGYFSACALEAGVGQIRSFEKNADVMWLRTLNPWSPDPDSAAAGGRLQFRHGDVSQQIEQVASNSVDAILHDPPRFGIAGELYSQVFYDHLARVIRKGGRLFHYTGAPNKLTSGRDVPREVAKRLEKAGFKAELALDGVLAVRR
ncbi:MnmC family methyltransferase [Stenotrophomonas maltophilia]|uniref:class I SAM-dependent methyltransferase n=1 Tax=Stenotrophomonas maltophilia TaxID=40324 RepID=UPI002410FF79|nr:MnmC family methyltransferase [Stenotrophomonas maltophilia]